ncbi:hypothetical protein [Nocardioides sp. P5_C9_2]
MRDIVARLCLVLALLASGVVLVRGLLMTTYFEPTGDALAVAGRGALWLWLGTGMLVGLVLVARRRWRVPVWVQLLVAASGPVCLVVHALGWIPLVAAPVVAFLVLASGACLLVSPRRPSRDLHRDQGHS